MTLDQLVTLGSVIISFLGLVFVGLQIHDNTRQRKAESQIRLYDINRELLSMGFDQPELFQILTGKDISDPNRQRRYLQLWLNQLALVHSFQQERAFRKEVSEGFERDFKDFIVLENMQKHWNTYGKYYPASFQDRVNATLNKAGASDTAKNSELAAQSSQT